LKEYNKAIQNLANTNSKLIFENYDINHASIVIGNIFRTSNEIVCIYDNDLSGDVLSSSEYINLEKEIEQFVSKKNTKLILVYKNQVNSKYHSFWKNLKLKYSVNLEIVKANDKLQNNVTDFLGSNLNFMVADKSKFRLEKTSESGDRGAICSFNNKGFSENLHNIFIDNYNQ